MANSAYHIIGPAWQHRPDWVPGEMLVESEVALADGYWNDPDRTRERFVTEPGTGRRLYRTGDLGRYLPDGNIEILGRTDFQVKIGGHRIELGEVEYHIMSVPGVRRAAVVKARSNTADAHRLVAFVEAPSGAESEIKQRLKDCLPGYMIPHDLRLVERLPLTGNGKVDRAGLEAEASVIRRGGARPSAQASR